MNCEKRTWLVNVHHHWRRWIFCFKSNKIKHKSIKLN